LLLRTRVGKIAIFFINLFLKLYQSEGLSIRLHLAIFFAPSQYAPELGAIPLKIRVMIPPEEQGIVRIIVRSKEENKRDQMTIHIASSLIPKKSCEIQTLYMPG